MAFRFSVIGSCIARDLFPMGDSRFQFFTDIRFTSPFTLVSPAVPENHRITMEDFPNQANRYGTEWFKKIFVMI